VRKWESQKAAVDFAEKEQLRSDKDGNPWAYTYSVYVEWPGGGRQDLKHETYPDFALMNKINRKSDLKSDDFYTLWMYDPKNDYYAIERTYSGSYFKSTLWDQMKDHNRISNKQAMVFKQGFDPNLRRRR
jgi:hypothetical protein